MEMNRMGVLAGTIIATACLVSAMIGLNQMYSKENEASDGLIDDIIDLVTDDEEPAVWQEIMQVEIRDLPYLGENTPTGGGWLATFCLDYAETPGTCLASNASGGGYDSWTNVSGYCDTDDTDTDLASDDPFYFVVRCRFNASQCKDGGVYKDSRTMVNLTVAGDEAIAGTAGTAVVSFNSTSADYIYINYYWDDGVDGYRITDDGSLTWSLVISAKY